MPLLIFWANNRFSPRVIPFWTLQLCPCHRHLSSSKRESKATGNEKEQYQTLESFILLSFYGYFSSRANSLCDFPTFTCFLLRSRNIFLLSSLDFLLLISTWFLGVTFSLPDVSFTIGSTLPLLYNLIWGAGKTTSVWGCHPALYFLGNGTGEVNPSGCLDNYAAGCKTLHYLAPHAHMFGRALSWMPLTQTLSSW